MANFRQVKYVGFYIGSSEVGFVQVAELMRYGQLRISWTKWYES